MDDGAPQVRDAATIALPVIVACKIGIAERSQTKEIRISRLPDDNPVPQGSFKIVKDSHHGFPMVHFEISSELRHLPA